MPVTPCDDQSTTLSNSLQDTLCHDQPTALSNSLQDTLCHDQPTALSSYVQYAHQRHLVLTSHISGKLYPVSPTNSSWNSSDLHRMVHHHCRQLPVTPPPPPQSHTQCLWPQGVHHEPTHQLSYLGRFNGVFGGCPPLAVWKNYHP